MARIDLIWIKAALDVGGRALTVVLIILLPLCALPAAAVLNLHYQPRTAQQEAWDSIAFVAILIYAAAGAGSLGYSLIGRRRLEAIGGFAAATILIAGFLLLKISRFG